MTEQFVLDTHTLLWMQDDSELLSTRAREVLSDSQCELYVSVASFWEITIKQSLGKLHLGYTIDELVQSCVISNIFILPIQMTYLNVLSSLPLIHRDPFDRLIAATAIEMKYKLLTKDINLHKYDLEVVW